MDDTYYLNFEQENEEGIIVSDDEQQPNPADFLEACLVRVFVIFLSFKVLLRPIYSVYSRLIFIIIRL